MEDQICFNFANICADSIPTSYYLGVCFMVLFPLAFGLFMSLFGNSNDHLE